MNRAAKLAKTRIAEGLEKRPEENGIVRAKLRASEVRRALPGVQIMGQEESAVDGCEEKSEETEVLSVGVVPHQGDDAWTVLAGLASQASDLFSHAGPPPEERVLCSVYTSWNS